ncbi:prepilin-type N-terminal cleavage/methylation domain-containing protein [Exiguobacterium sp.]|uniref:prepilin-type N-terminal cleavage/methylation domain-containing protein n=1 Tax=Exiguobacterium sp. TaxID=44751 RepID=UPI00263BE071|nr:prepilin-type N-terminal cleavage/methylation domain-containing protein [Exiguobacterium sp.]MCC5892603.1 prepilin-type N-terminal cleavage/methylation domain-containing protein [Exiguobacterium sp.]
MLDKMKMIWQDAKQLKDERGLTLVELLVVVVILGIIAAIAVVAIGGIIENSKKDAMVADAKQMVSAAKLHTASNPEAASLDFTKEVGQSYISKLNDPFGDEYSKALVTITPDGNKYSYSVQLVGKKAIGASTPVAESAINKDAIVDTE